MTSGRPPRLPSHARGRRSSSSGPKAQSRMATRSRGAAARSAGLRLASHGSAKPGLTTRHRAAIRPDETLLNSAPTDRSRHRLPLQPLVPRSRREPPPDPGAGLLAIIPHEGPPHRA